jgi:hypothetical protein
VESQIILNASRKRPAPAQEIQGSPDVQQRNASADEDSLIRLSGFGKYLILSYISRDCKTAYFLLSFKESTGKTDALAAVTTLMISKQFFELDGNASIWRKA